MKLRLIRFVLPFLFERNWHTGEWEWSRPRLYLVGCLVVLILVALGLLYYMSQPVVYTRDGL